ncbi:hypothetical protein E2C01_027569 [Portunus trituberculatus]|uniref:Uncharacterized protein n=1 Tax=Portunus trituberculatus TaxID=210409 RepID=A0A5B7ELI2_PORTR|nr:hypothetical protein [Portunus trituberculatus]
MRLYFRQNTEFSECLDHHRPRLALSLRCVISPHRRHQNTQTRKSVPGRSVQALHSKLLLHPPTLHNTSHITVPGCWCALSSSYSSLSSPSLSEECPPQHVPPSHPRWP